MPHTTRSTQHLILLAVLLLAFSLRVHRLGVQSLWYDEAVTAQVTGQGIAELTRWTAGDIQPPLYYYAVAGWTRLAGRSEWALRFPSAFFGVLTVALLWAAARRLFGRGRGGQRAALAAASLGALSPLYVYYAQEARMYTLLTVLGLLAGYALLRASEPGSGGAGGRGSAHWWVIFVVASAAMLYTHYFGAFLLAAYGLCWAVGITKLPAQLPSLRRGGGGGGGKNAAYAILAFLAIMLLYLPWLPAMFNRYRVDRSYWQGALKLDEALRHVAISFTTGAPETMLESAAVRLLPWFGGVFLVAVIALLWQGRGGAKMPGNRSALTLLLVALLAPVAAILLLASRTPKFNPRYLLLASPAYYLILAGGVGALGGRRGEEANRRIGESANHAPRNTQYAIRNTRHAPRTTHHALRCASALLLASFLVATSLLGLRNWFADPAFTKAQWRELAAAVRGQITSDEAVLLVSGHASPAWDYYAPEIARTRLPDIDVLDVAVVLGFGSGTALAQALAGKTGAWLVSWQDDVVDPAGFVPYFLDRAGVEQPVGPKFWRLGLRHWRLRSGATFPTAPDPGHVQGANFDHKLALLGWDDPQAGQLTVYWRTLNTLPVDYQVSLILEDAQGQEVGRWDGRPAGYAYPTTRWQPGQALFGRYPLPLSPGAPAGDYTVTLAVYNAGNPAGLDIRDIADNPAGKRVRLGPIHIQH